MAGPSLAFLYNFSYAETIIVTVAGGMGGVVLVSYCSPLLVNIWRWISAKWNSIFQNRKKTTPFSQPTIDVEDPMNVNYVYVPSKESNKKVFTRRNRRFVRIWRRYGLIGIALITPVLISIPVGTFIANRLVPNRKKVFLYMFFSLLFWSIILTTLFEIYHVVSIAELQTGIIQ